MRDVRARHWTAAGTAALGLHAAVGLWVLQVPGQPAASPGGGGGVEVMLASAADPSAAQAPAGPRQDAVQVSSQPAVAPPAPPVEPVTTPVAEMAEAPRAEAVPEVAPPVETPPPPTVQKVAAPKPVRPEPVRPEPVRPEPAAVPATIVASAPIPRAVPPPTPEAVTAVDVVAPPVPQPRPVIPEREPAPKPVQSAETPPAAGPVSASAENQGRTGAQSAGGQPAPHADRGAAAQAASAPGGAADYMSQLRAWLERHKEYPYQARRRRVEGTAMLVFVMDRGGTVLSHRIERSAGDPSLDRAVGEMIRRAQPLPPLPDSFPQARLEVRVPVQFLLR